MNNEQIISRIEDFFKDIHFDFCPMQYIDEEYILQKVKEKELTIECMYEELQDKNAFSYEAEFIYYSEAIEYLANNDQSLVDSMELANDLGYTTENINSCLLATMLKEDILTNTFWEYKEEIDELLEELQQ